MKTYFFGCIHQVGHDLHGKGSELWPFSKCVPWGFELDSKLCPGRGNTIENKQLQGHTAIHHKDGWTAITWWDRSGPDTRMGCNSALLAEGKHDFEQMKVLLKEYWPEMHNRQPVELFLKEQTP